MTPPLKDVPVDRVQTQPAFRPVAHSAGGSRNDTGLFPAGKVATRFWEISQAAFTPPARQLTRILADLTARIRCDQVGVLQIILDSRHRGTTFCASY